jgi:hypothetical protein
MVEFKKSAAYAKVSKRNLKFRFDRVNEAFFCSFPRVLQSPGAEICLGYLNALLKFHMHDVTHIKNASHPSNPIANQHPVPGYSTSLFLLNNLLIEIFGNFENCYFVGRMSKTNTQDLSSMNVH